MGVMDVQNFVMLLIFFWMVFESFNYQINMCSDLIHVSVTDLTVKG